jgi:hypothetical protein
VGVYFSKDRSFHFLKSLLDTHPPTPTHRHLTHLCHVKYSLCCSKNFVQKEWRALSPNMHRVVIGCGAALVATVGLLVFVNARSMFRSHVPAMNRPRARSFVRLCTRSSASTITTVEATSCNLFLSCSADVMARFGQP